MTAIFSLMFLATPESVLIAQLGHVDFQKRASADKALRAVLSQTDGCKNYSLLLAVKMATESRDAEIRRRATSIYEANRSRFYRENRYVAVVLSKSDETKKYVGLGDTRIAGLRQSCNTTTPLHYTLIILTPKNFDSSMLNAIKGVKGVEKVVPTDDRLYNLYER